MMTLHVAAKAVLATAVMLGSQASAMMQHPREVIDRILLYKNVRKLISSNVNGERELQNATTKLTTTCFTKCIEENMTADQCIAYIQEAIAAAGGHEAGEITVAVQTPRDPLVLSETYWMAEVPTNIQGQVACDLHNGIVEYPYPWQYPITSGGGSVQVQPVPCQGKTAGDCCLAIRRMGQTSELGGKDINGQCLACFPHQELLIPVPELSGTDGSILQYKDYTWDGSSCVPTTLTLEEVTALDQAKAGIISTAIQALKDFLEAPEPPSCASFETLLGQLYDASVTIPALPQLLGQLSCKTCYEIEQVVYETTPETIALTVEIFATMTKASVPVSSQSTVVIYTNSDGTIQEVPKLGGTRTDDDKTDDCQDAGETPTEPTGPSSAEGWYLPELPSGGDDLENNICFIPSSTVSEIILGVYQEPGLGIKCHDYSAEDDKTNEKLDYSIQYVSRAFDASAEITRFFYDVCTAKLECTTGGRRDRQRFLRRGLAESFDSKAAISHVTLGLLGACSVTGFGMYDIDGTLATIDFGEAPEFTIGTDSTTCSSGFKFEAGWSAVSDMGCESGNWCRKLMIEISGDVPVSNYIGAIKASTGYTIVNDLSVPDCRKECVLP